MYLSAARELGNDTINDTVNGRGRGRDEPVDDGGERGLADDTDFRRLHRGDLYYLRTILADTQNGRDGRRTESLRQGDHEGAAKACEEEGSPLARVLAKGIRTRKEDAGEVRRGMEETANKEVAAIERGLPTLATCAGIAPMIGFLGTVVGMVQSFYDMSTAGNSIDIGLLSRGIYTAMITTVAGLIVGIIGQLGYNFLVARVDKIVARMEYYSSELIELLHAKK